MFGKTLVNSTVSLAEAHPQAVFWISADMTQSGPGPAVPFGGSAERLQVYGHLRRLQKEQQPTLAG